MMIFMSIASKIIGTLFACHYLKIPTDEGIVLGFLLDLKGNAELQILGKLPKETVSFWKNYQYPRAFLNYSMAGCVDMNTEKKNRSLLSANDIILCFSYS
jgi:hypothetical protein